MLHKLYTLYDEKAKTYGNIIIAKTRADFLRNLTSALSNEQSGLLFSNPEDFIVYEIGSWDNETADVMSIDNRENLGRASEYK